MKTLSVCVAALFVMLLCATVLAQQGLHTIHSQQQGVHTEGAQQGVHTVQQYVRNGADTLPSDLPIPTIRIAKNTSAGFMFASVPFWGKGNCYIVAYDNTGRPVLYKKVSSVCMDFKPQDNGCLTYYEYESKKFIVLDSTLTPVRSYRAQNGYTTDGHELKILANGHVLLIGYAYKNVDMSLVVPGGSHTANVVVNAIQELDEWDQVVFEWKADEYFSYADVGPEVDLLDESFEFMHINSIDVDRDGGLIISSRHLDEVTKIDRKTGAIVWRFGGKKNQFRFTNDTIGFNAQHAVRVLPNGNLLLFDNGNYHATHYSRALEYSLDTVNKTATLVWSHRNMPDVASALWGNAQRLNNGNTFIAWGDAGIAATEVDTAGNTVFEISFPRDVHSYRIYRLPMVKGNAISAVVGSGAVLKFSLDQNFPNPFNPTTTIRYTLPAQAVWQTSICVFDVLGRVVANISDGVQSAGTHEVSWNASVPSGVYWYRFDAISTSDPARRYRHIKKMLLVR